MNMKSRFGLAAVLLVFVIGAAALNVSGVQAAGKPTDVPGGGAGNGRGGQAVANTNAVPAALAPLSAQEADGLLFMAQEEQLARDVYTQMYATWQLPLFQTIAVSEQNHMDRIAGLLTRYGLTAPAQTPGVFANAELQDLYNQLVAQGSTSIVAAKQVGVAIEQKDIQDLQTRLDETTHRDIQMVYSNLLAGSNNHLWAFSTQ